MEGLSKDHQSLALKELCTARKKNNVFRFFKLRVNFSLRFWFWVQIGLADGLDYLRTDRVEAGIAEAVPRLAYFPPPVADELTLHWKANIHF